MTTTTTMLHPTTTTMLFHCETCTSLGRRDGQHLNGAALLRERLLCELLVQLAPHVRQLRVLRPVRARGGGGRGGHGEAVQGVVLLRPKRLVLPRQRLDAPAGAGRAAPGEGEGLRRVRLVRGEGRGVSD